MLKNLKLFIFIFLFIYFFSHINNVFATSTPIFTENLSATNTIYFQNATPTPLIVSTDSNSIYDWEYSYNNLTWNNILKNNKTIINLPLYSSANSFVFDKEGNIFITHAYNNSIIKISKNLNEEYTSTIIGYASVSGVALPKSITIDSNGNLYVANSFTNNVVKLTKNNDGTYTTSHFANTDAEPIFIYTDKLNNIYTLNKSSSTITKITPEGVSSLFASTIINGIGQTPSYMNIDNDGNFYIVSNNLDNSIIKINQYGSSSIFVNSLFSVSYISVDKNNNIYASGIGSTYMYKINPNKNITTYNIGEQVLSTFIDDFGYIYTANYSKTISRISPDGSSIRVVGNSLNIPNNIYVDNEKNIYTYNYSSSSILKIFNSNILIPDTKNTGITNYRVKAINGDGESISNISKIIISDFKISKDLIENTIFHPLNSTSTSLSVSVSGGVSPFSYQWKEAEYSSGICGDFTNINSSINTSSTTSYFFPPTSNLSEKCYSVLITDNNDVPISLNSKNTKVVVYDENLLRFVESISLSTSSLRLFKGATTTISATINPNNATNLNFSWYSSSPSVATIDADGLITAISSGTTTISAITADGNKIATSSLSVITPLESIGFNSTSTIANLNGTTAVPVIYYPSDASNRNIFWSSLDSNIARVDNFGIITGMNLGTTEIVVISEEGNYSARFFVNVTIPVSNISLSTSSLVLYKGATTSILANIFPSDAYNKNFSWYSSSSSVATIDADGLITAISSGTTTISAITADGNKIATSSLVVISPVTNLSLSTSSIVLFKNNFADIISNVAPLDATNKNIIWTSSNPSVASVNASGTIFAIRSGNATITATTLDGGLTSFVSVLVITNLTNITFATSSININLGYPTSTPLIITPSDASILNFVWTSSRPSIVNVDEFGVLTGLKIGSSTIYLISEDLNKTISILVNVKQLPIFINNLSTSSIMYAVNSNSIPLSISATGSPALSYQWYSNTINSTSSATLISNATSTIYTPSTFESGIKYYFVRISNSQGFVDSNIIPILIYELPIFYSISGSISYFSSTSIPISGAQISLTNTDNNTLVSTTTTNNTGAYTFNNVSTGGNYNISVSYTSSSSVNGININDNVRNAQIIVGTYTPTDDAKISADTNQDGIIDINDNVKNAQIIVGTYQLPIPFIFIPTDKTNLHATSTENSITKKNYLWPSYQSKTINNLNSNQIINFKGYKVGDSNGDWR